VIQIAIDNDGSRKITEILQVTKRIEGEHIETDPIWTLANGAYFKGALKI
jgi:hypothetical protein